MCYPVPCSTCAKTTWNGCGEHVAEVMVNVAEQQRCTCESPVPAG